MGLESVELVLNVEDAFGISIPDDIASDVRTVGQLHSVILDLLRAKDDRAWLSRPDGEQAVWFKVATLAAKLSSGVRPADVTPSTRFIEDLGYG
jgi:hypothetical protein